MADMPPDQQPQFQTSVDVKLDYIQRDISKIELNIQKIQGDVIGRREFTDSMAALRKEFNDANLQLKTEFIDAVKGVKKDISLPNKILYGAVGLILVAFMTVIIQAHLK